MGQIILYYFYRIKIKHCSVLICYFHSLKVTRMQEPRSLNFFQWYALRPPTMVSCSWWPFLDYCCNTSKLSKSTFQKKNNVSLSMAKTCCSTMETIPTEMNILINNRWIVGGWNRVKHLLIKRDAVHIYIWGTTVWLHWLFKLPDALTGSVRI